MREFLCAERCCVRVDCIECEKVGEKEIDVRRRGVGDRINEDKRMVKSEKIWGDLKIWKKSEKSDFVRK